MTTHLATAKGMARLQEHVRELEAAIDRVRRFHSQRSEIGLAPGKWCPGCGEVEPCRTIRALNGDPR